MKAVKFDAKIKTLLMFVNVVLVVAMIGVVVIFNKTGQVKRVARTTEQVDNSKTTREVVVSPDKLKLNPKSIKFMADLAKKQRLATAVGGDKLGNGSLKLPDYQLEGEAFGLKIAKTDGFYYIYKSDFGKRQEVGGMVWRAIVDEAKSQGYRLAKDSDDMQFDNEQMVCRLVRTSVANPKLKNKDTLLVANLSLSCLDKAYLAGLYNFYRPMVAVLTQDRQALKSFRLNSQLAVSEVAVMPSVTPGYQTAQLRFVGDNLSHLLYQKQGNNWQYFQSVDRRLLSCQDFNTDTLKKAYWGNDCLNAKGELATVLDKTK